MSGLKSASRSSGPGPMENSEPPRRAHGGDFHDLQGEDMEHNCPVEGREPALALAKSRHSYGLMHGHDVETCVVCEQTANAIREALISQEDAEIACASAAQACAAFQQRVEALEKALDWILEYSEDGHVCRIARATLRDWKRG